MLDTYGYTHKHPATVEDQHEEMQAHFLKRGGVKPAYEECDCCGSWHPVGYFGDCRNDLYRIDDPDELHGPDGWDAA